MLNKNMHCSNCGVQLSMNARFCANCGASVGDEETRLAPRHASTAAGTPALDNRAGATAENLERVIFTARPTFLFIAIGYALAALAAILLTGIFAFFLPNLSIWLSLVLTLPLLLIPAFRHLKRNTVRYTLTDSRVEFAQGLMVRTTRNIPLRSIQDVTVTATILQRMLGFGSVLIDDASEQGGTTALRDIPQPHRHAEIILNELRRR